ncbi:MAG: dienelactone hydrolase family protein, partial [Planctomycetia bacterium]
PIDVAGQLQAPVLGLYGGADQAIPNETVEQMREALKHADKASEIVLYPDTPHGFHADYRPTYRQEQATDAWAKCLNWLERNGVE